jgi:hypothetical protein
MSDHWQALEDELGRWADQGLTATFWWRDDDAGEDNKALRRLLEQAAQLSVPLALAAVPCALTPEAAGHIVGAPDVAVRQHGFAHANHEPPTVKKAELGASRKQGDVVRELAAGRVLLEARGVAPLHVLVPPWNRIDPALLHELSDLKISGLSCYGARGSAWAAPGVLQVNSHIDLIEWRGSRGFVGEAAAIGLAVTHLVARRRGETDAAEPTGLLSHHADHDEDTWRFIDDFVARTSAHPAADWLAAGAVFDHGSAA